MNDAPAIPDDGIRRQPGESLDSWFARKAAAAPPLTDEQADLLRSLLRPAEADPAVKTRPARSA